MRTPIGQALETLKPLVAFVKMLYKELSAQAVGLAQIRRVGGTCDPQQVSLYRLGDPAFLQSNHEHSQPLRGVFALSQPLAFAHVIEACAALEETVEGHAHLL